MPSFRIRLSIPPVLFPMVPLHPWIRVQTFPSPMIPAFLKRVANTQRTSCCVAVVSFLSAHSFFLLSSYLDTAMRPASFRSWHRVLLHQLHVVPPARHARGYGCDTRLVSYFSGLFRASLNVVLKRPSGACMFLVLITSMF